MNDAGPSARPHGQIRLSQVVMTFGPGSLLDLPTHSVIVGGLDHWSGVTEVVHEPRLIEKLRRLLNMPALKLFSPPPDNEDPTAAHRYYRLAIPRMVHHPGCRKRWQGWSYSLKTPGKSKIADQGQVHRQRQEETSCGADPICAGLPPRSHRRH